jgi:hypothetical protein
MYSSNIVQQIVVNLDSKQLNERKQVYEKEGKCLNGRFNCYYIRARPGLSMNYQPVVGKPLPNKYIQTMGSLLSKKRQNSLTIKNAIASRKNTVVFLSPGTHCSAPKKCIECTGNKNPNNNPI